MIISFYLCLPSDKFVIPVCSHVIIQNLLIYGWRIAGCDTAPSRLSISVLCKQIGDIVQDLSMVGGQPDVPQHPAVFL